MLNSSADYEKTIILASKSPRRQEILKKLDISFIVKPPDIIENLGSNNPAEAVIQLAEEKALKVSSLNDIPGARWFLAADTVVTAAGKIMGQPADDAEAEQYLRLLSGLKHRVLTGLALIDLKKSKIYKNYSSTDVFFADLSDAEIRWYISTGEWKGAAGGYRIQEKGECLVKKIEGSYSNVMGLPIRLLFCILLDAGYPAFNNLPPGCYIT